MQKWLQDGSGLRNRLSLPAVLALCGILLLAGCSAKEGGEEPAAVASVWSDGTIQSSRPIDLTAVRADTPVAENAGLRLLVDEANGQLRIEDKRTGKVWSGMSGEQFDIPAANLKAIANPLNIKYTSGKEIVLTNPEREKGLIATERKENGIRFHYNIESLGLTFAVDYTLLENGLEVRIPFELIRESGSARLTAIEPLPFFEAAMASDDGALLVPDGSGALIRFKEQRAQNFEFYSEYIYGGDHAFQLSVYQKVGAIRVETVSKSPRERIALPVFGLYKERQGYLGIVTAGDTDAKINAYPAGIRNIALYRISTEFMYRNNDVVFVGNSGEIPMTERSLIEGDRAISYVLLQDEQSDYNGMAAAYRRHLQENGKLSQQAAEGEAGNIQLRLFGGVKRPEIVGNTFIAMTTFQEAKRIVDQFTAAGATNLEVVYEGWSAGGLLGDQPDHFPVPNKLGGEKGLRELAVGLKEQGIPLYLEANYVKPYSESDGLRPRNHAIRGLNKEVMNINKPFLTTLQHSSELYYLVKPEWVKNKYVLKEAKRMEELGVAGVHMNYMGELIYSDHDGDAPFRRAQTADVWRQSLDAARAAAGKASVAYGNAYTLGHIDRIDNIPMFSSGFTYTDEAIPFYQLVVHGYLPYSAYPANQSDDPRFYKLKLLEYGALPQFTAAGQNTELLKRTFIDDRFKADAAYILDTDVKQLAEATELLAAVSGYEITAHTIVEAGVYRTEYGDGTTVTVNYNHRPVTIDGTVIEALGYTAVKGGVGR